MARFYDVLFCAMWGAWVTYWWTLSRRVKVNVRRESGASRLSYVVTLLVAVALLALPDVPYPMINERFLPAATWPLWAGTGAAITLTGLLFTVWARMHLGNNWSDVVSIKVDHELITSGPYRLVRHPIYTGLIGAMIATGVAVGTATALLGTALIAFGLWQKARMEEGFLTTELGADAYGPYCRRVPMLVPFLPQR